mgnify:CR=1 FL=1
MLFILFYYIICDSVTFENMETLTQSVVQEKMKETITEVFIKNISIIGDQAFYYFPSLEYVSFQEPLILTSIGEIFL